MGGCSCLGWLVCGIVWVGCCVRQVPVVCRRGLLCNAHRRCALLCCASSVSASAAAVAPSRTWCKHSNNHLWQRCCHARITCHFLALQLLFCATVQLGGRLLHFRCVGSPFRRAGVSARFVFHVCCGWLLLALFFSVPQAAVAALSAACTAVFWLQFFMWDGR